MSAFLLQHQIGLNKSIQFPIHYRTYISYLVIGSVILNHFIGMENIAALDSELAFGAAAPLG